MSPAGLCDACRFARTVVTRRGGTFRMCLRSEDDPRFPRYPRLPVLVCPGYEAGPPRGPAGDGRIPRP